MSQGNISFQNQDNNPKPHLIQSEQYELREGFADIESEDNEQLLNTVYENIFSISNTIHRYSLPHEMNDYDGYSFFE
jgi:hypothetical protein